MLFKLCIQHLLSVIVTRIMENGLMFGSSGSVSVSEILAVLRPSLFTLFGLSFEYSYQTLKTETSKSFRTVKKQYATEGLCVKYQMLLLRSKF